MAGPELGEARTMSWMIAIAAQAAAALAPAPPAAAPATPVAGAVPFSDDAILAEINRVRADPAGYVADLRAYRDTLKDKVAYPEGYPNGVMTNEGAAAIDDAIDFMTRQHPLPPLIASPLLARSAAELTTDQTQNGGSGNLTSDGRNASARSQHNGGDMFVGEVIAYGPANAHDMVRQLIIDDGYDDRGHRIMLFSPLYAYAGVSCATHPTYRLMCTVDLSATTNGAAPTQ